MEGEAGCGEQRREQYHVPLTWLTSSREQTGEKILSEVTAPLAAPVDGHPDENEKNETAAPGWFGSFRYIKIKKL